MSSRQGGAPHQIFINSHNLSLPNHRYSDINCLMITLKLREILWAEPDSQCWPHNVDVHSAGVQNRSLTIDPRLLQPAAAGGSRHIDPGCSSDGGR